MIDADAIAAACGKTVVLTYLSRDGIRDVVGNLLRVKRAMTPGGGRETTVVRLKPAVAGREVMTVTLVRIDRITLWADGSIVVTRDPAERRRWLGL